MATAAEHNPQVTEPISSDTNTSTMNHMNEDPFAAQREDGTTMDKNLEDIAGDKDMAMPEDGSPTSDRRLSKEWDAAKVPPSQFQKRKGSLYSTPSSRDSHANGSDRDKAYFDKLKEKGWNVLKK